MSVGIEKTWRRETQQGSTQYVEALHITDRWRKAEYAMVTRDEVASVLRDARNRRLAIHRLWGICGVGSCGYEAMGRRFVPRRAYHFTRMGV